MVHKWWRVLLVYLAGVIAGSVATSVVDPTMKLAGASGGVYSLVTAHIASIIMVIQFLYNEFHNFCLVMLLTNLFIIINYFSYRWL